MSLHVTEATSLNRIKDFNKSAIDRFYDLLKEFGDANQLTPDCIFTMAISEYNFVKMYVWGDKWVGLT